MHSPEKAALINQTANQWWSVLVTKQEQYDLLFHLLGKNRFKRVSYIKKKAKAAKEKIDEELELKIANSNYMSTKQLNELRNFELM